MNCALILDAGGSPAFPADRLVAGRPLAVYPLLAARASHSLRRVFLMTDSREIKDAALQHQAIILDPPVAPDAPALGAFIAHGVETIARELKAEGAELKLLALMFTFAPCVTGELVDEGIRVLEEDAQADSALTVSRYDHWHPLSALRDDPAGVLRPYISSRLAPAGGVWYPDWGLSVIRPRCLESAEDAAGEIPGLTPWLGRRPRAIASEGGSPVVSEWQVPAAELWLKKRGIPDATQTLEPKPQPKPQAAPKGDRR